MAKESGVKVILKVGDAADPEVFTDLKGQKDTRMSGAGNAIDVSDKTTGGWGSTLAGTRNMTVTASGLVVWPDTTGIDVLRGHWEAGTTVNCELVLNDNGDKYSGAFSITQLDIGGASDGATEYSVTLQNAGQPTHS
ncbi:phage tail tube protein [Kiloniella antarctica]|uniref:Phage tail tube protein n=1 Tax=Kiloniella antarctica TaxID=1550907 RepID=A0ABW5BKI7_9PROT